MAAIISCPGVAVGDAQAGGDLHEAAAAELPRRVLKDRSQLGAVCPEDALLVAEGQRREDRLVGDVSRADAHANVAAVEDGQCAVADHHLCFFVLVVLLLPLVKVPAGKVARHGVGDQVAQVALRVAAGVRVEVHLGEADHLHQVGVQLAAQALHQLLGLWI